MENKEVTYGSYMENPVTGLSDKELSDHGAVAYAYPMEGPARDLEDVDLSDHGAVAYAYPMEGPARDLVDVDLSDHGAVAYAYPMEGPARDLVDVDLSDHGAVAYAYPMEGPARDLVDVDLSDHGAVSYVPLTESYGTSDEEIANQMNMLMHATYSDKVNQIIPVLNSASLAKVIDYRYKMVANTIDRSMYGMSLDDKQRLGTDLYMDFVVIDSMITNNPNCLQPIFNPSLYVGEKNYTDVFGLLEKYKQDIESIGVIIPLIDGSTGKNVVDSNGNVVTATDYLQYLMTKCEELKKENTVSRSI